MSEYSVESSDPKKATATKAANAIRAINNEYSTRLAPRSSLGKWLATLAHMARTIPPGND
jgi:hypothetical protein